MSKIALNNVAGRVVFVERAARERDLSIIRIRRFKAVVVSSPGAIVPLREVVKRVVSHRLREHAAVSASSYFVLLQPASEIVFVRLTKVTMDVIRNARDQTIAAVRIVGTLDVARHAVARRVIHGPHRIVIAHRQSCLRRGAHFHFFDHAEGSVFYLRRKCGGSDKRAVASTTYRRRASTFIKRISRYTVEWICDRSQTASRFILVRQFMMIDMVKFFRTRVSRCFSQFLILKTSFKLLGA